MSPSSHLVPTEGQYRLHLITPPIVIASDRRERRNLMVKIIAEIAEPVPSLALSKKANQQKDEIASPLTRRGARNDGRGISLLAKTVFM
jgi:hypothetical protein